ncbi:MAG: lytic murein transglycosylase [Rhodospirillaceae bacterium]|nr:lytic murein transglycosylase [Rhodospirillaceae bacterium]MBT6137727.1 lytic murein transglycosylase [Rhodospirillaceae bacterium]
MYALHRLAALAIVATATIALPADARAAEAFDVWLKGVRTEALGRGIKPKTLDDAFAGVKPIPRIIELDRKQPEFTLTFQQYLTRVVNDRRVRKGKKLLNTHAELLRKVSEKYRVQPRFIISLWGIETDYGRITGGFPVVASLATLAYDGRRSKFFRKEMMLALEIIDQGHISAKAMKGSWAGAMGQNQFMPSSFHAYAVDYDGDGNKDIWGTLPDVFASIANYLSRSGWKNDRTWGREAKLPADFPMKLSGKKIKKPLSEWSKLGVRRVDGSALPTRDIKASIALPARKKRSPAYIAYSNYNVILKWNRSDYFAVAVGTLADRIQSR